MPSPVIRGGGLVSLELSPPVEFIEAQTGAFQARLEDLMPLWDRFVPVLAGIEREQFATEGHGDWPPLAASTVAEKERHGFPPDPLIRTGALVESLTDAGQAARLDPHQMSYGTDVDYAIYHQGYRDTGGDPTDPGRPPVRKVIDITVSDRRRLEAEMVGWINEVAAETLGRMAA